MLKDSLVYVGHIIERAEKIQRFTKDMSEEEFLKDEKTLSAVMRELEVMGEASNRISEPFKLQYPEVPWRLMIAMRNLLIHDYEGANPYRVWDTIKTNIPPLLTQLNKITGKK